MLPPSGLRRTVLFTGESLSWKSAFNSGERQIKTTQTTCDRKTFRDLDKIHGKTFSQQHNNISELIA
jgi:hypothetical protein